MAAGGCCFEKGSPPDFRAQWERADAMQRQRDNRNAHQHERHPCKPHRAESLAEHHGRSHGPDTGSEQGERSNSACRVTLQQVSPYSISKNGGHYAKV